LIFTVISVTDPMQWSESHVAQWLNWAIQEFTLEGVNVNNFSMRGNQLCKMEKEKFLKLAPPFMGDILWEHLDILQKGEFSNHSSCSTCTYIQGTLGLLSITSEIGTLFIALRHCAVSSYF